MKKVYRSLLLFLSMVIFFAVAPLVILYAVGYRASLNSVRAVDPLPVGVLAIETQPRRATINIDGQDVGNSSRVVANLPPGVAEVKVTLNGYQAWEKKVNIEPGRASEFRNIVLVPEKLQSNNLIQNARVFALAPNGRLLAVIHNNRQLLILDEKGQAVLPDMVVPAIVGDMVWAPDNSALLINSTRGTHYVLNVAQGRTPTHLSMLNQAKDITWDSRLSGRILYIDSTNSLRALNVATQQHLSLIDKVKTFTANSDEIFAVTSDNKVGVYTFAGDNLKNLPVPQGTIQKLITSDNGHVAYLMKDKSLWLLDENDNLKKISDSTKEAAWSSGGQMLLVQPDANSLYVYNYGDERNPIPVHSMQLIARLSRPITHPRWFSDGVHIIYQIQDEIWFSETDPRDHAVSYQIDTTNNGYAGAVGGANGAALYYLQRIGGQNSLVVTSLIAK